MLSPKYYKSLGEKKEEEESWNKKRKIGSVRALITWDWLI
jgi:hypothetical protein